MQFRLGTIPVRVHASFLVMVLVLASTWTSDPLALGIVAVVMAASVLVHELGHALTGRAFGLTPGIDLVAMGGLTSWTRGRDLSNGKRVLISAAGPLVGLGVAAIAWTAERAALLPAHGLAAAALQATLQVNLYWSIFNLLPMIPLDGGSVTLHALNALTSGRGETPARLVSLAVAVAVALAALAMHPPQVIMLLLAASFAVRNAMGLAGARKLRQDAPLRRALGDAIVSLQRGEARDAIAKAEAIAQETQSPELRLEALRVLAYALTADGRWGQLLQLLEGGLARAIGEDDLARFEGAARESGSRDAGDAIAALRAEPADQPAEPAGPTGPRGDFHAG